MKNLSPKAILLFGIPISLVTNLCVVGSLCAMYELSSWEFAAVTTIISMGVWLLLGVPLFIGMAILRHGIDKAKKKKRQAFARFQCCSILASGIILGLTGIYWSHGRIEPTYQIIESASALGGILSVALLILTFVNSLLDCSKEGSLAQVIAK